MEVKDCLSQGRLAISDLFIISDEDDASWVRSGTMKDKVQNWLTPDMSRDERRSPAFRIYKPGDNFEYMAAVYNANHKDRAPDLESQFILYRDGSEYLRGEWRGVELSGLDDLSRIPIRKRMLLGETLPEGDYVLQLVIKDKQKSGENSVAAQSLHFQIKM